MAHKQMASSLIGHGTVSEIAAALYLMQLLRVVVIISDIQICVISLSLCSKAVPVQYGLILYRKMFIVF